MSIATFAANKAPIVIANLAGHVSDPTSKAKLASLIGAPGGGFLIFIEQLIQQYLPALIGCLVPPAPTPTPPAVHAVLQQVADPIRGIAQRWELSKGISAAINDAEIEGILKLPLRMELVAQCKASTESDAESIVAA